MALFDTVGRMVRRAFAILAVSGFALLAIPACKKKPPAPAGESCEEDASVACVPGGTGPEGSPCQGESWDCEGNVLVRCVAGAYRHFECGGARGCARKETAVTCDATLARLGAPCEHEGARACSTHHEERYVCKGGTFALDRRCGGPKGCAVTSTGEDRYALDCDASLAAVGDPCTEVGGGTCSIDKKSLLTCEGKAFVVASVCRGAKAECVIESGVVQCAELGVSEVGDPCQSGSACTGDGKSLLACKGGAFAFAKKCRSCKVTGNDVRCT